MSSNIDDRLNWLATQYVLGEMSGSEQDAFELRLADDLTACEAVARASQLRLALHAVFAESEIPVHAQPSAIPERRRSRIAVAVSIAAIACMFLVMILWSGHFVDQSDHRVTGRSNREAAELVSRWRSDTKPIDDDVDDTDDEVQDDASDAAIPGWLMAGVQLEEHGAVKGHLEELQEN